MVRLSGRIGVEFSIHNDALTALRDFAANSGYTLEQALNGVVSVLKLFDDLQKSHGRIWYIPSAAEQEITGNYGTGMLAHKINLKRLRAKGRVITLTIPLPVASKEQLDAYTRTHDISTGTAIERAVFILYANKAQGLCTRQGFKKFTRCVIMTSFELE